MKSDILLLNASLSQIERNIGKVKLHINSEPSNLLLRLMESELQIAKDCLKDIATQHQLTEKNASKHSRT